MLVVLVILMGLLALLFPAVQSTRESARASNCRNNLRQLDIACRQYMDDNQTVPNNWTVELLLYLEEIPTFDLIERGDTPTIRPAVYVCPSHTDFSTGGPSGGASLYVMFAHDSPRIGSFARFQDRSTELSDNQIVPWYLEGSMPVEIQPDRHGPHRGKYLHSIGQLLK
jgi:type II secretory pathway pseudopilin PulG